jgi:hypothetical protein
MKIQPSFQKSISMNVTNWKIHRAGVHWLRIFSTTEDFDAWRKGGVVIPEVRSDNAQLDEAIVDDMVTVHMAMDQLNPFGSPTVLVGYYSPAVDELVRGIFIGGTRPLFGTPGHRVSTRTALVLATVPPTTDTVVHTLGGATIRGGAQAAGS